MAYVCVHEGCGKAFTLQRNLRRHEKLHQGNLKRFACPQCSSSFARGSDLKTHLRSHSGEKPYRCAHSGCGKRFSRASDLRIHERRHSNKRPFKCEVCHKAFFRPCDLTTHTQSKTHTLAVERARLQADAARVEPVHAPVPLGAQRAVVVAAPVLPAASSVLEPLCGRVASDLVGLLAAPDPEPAAPGLGQPSGLDILGAVLRRETECKWADCTCQKPCKCKHACTCGKREKSLEEWLVDEPVVQGPCCSSAPPALRLDAPPAGGVSSAAIANLKDTYRCQWKDCSCGMLCTCSGTCACGTLPKDDQDWAELAAYIDTLAAQEAPGAFLQPAPLLQGAT